MKKQIAAALVITLLTTTANAVEITGFYIKNGRWVIDGSANEDAAEVIMSVSGDENNQLTDIRQQDLDGGSFSFDLPTITANGFYTVKVRDSKDSAPSVRKVYLTDNKNSGVMYDSSEDSDYAAWHVFGDGSGRLMSNGKYNLGSSGNGETTAYLDGFFNAMDYSFSLDISAASRDMTEEILFRYIDENNYCYFKNPITSGDGRIYEMGYVKDGIKTAAYQQKMTDGEGAAVKYYNIRIECLGYESRAYVDGELAGRLYDEDLDRGTIGVRAINAKVNFNNVYVENLIDTVRTGKIEFLSESGDPLYSIPKSGKVTVRAKAENISDTESSKVMLAAAVYENGRLVSLKTDRRSILPEEKKDYEVILEGVAQDKTVRAFFWDDFLSQKPLNTAESINDKGGRNIYVDVNYSGESDGSIDCPYKTVADAIDRAKAVKSEDGLGENGIRIMIREGEYELDSTLNLSGEQISGTLMQPIVIAAYKGENVSVKGSKKIDTENAVISDNVRIPDSAKGKVYEISLGFDTAPIESFDYTAPAKKYTNVLYDGKVQPLAKYPNDGWIKTSGIYDKNGTKLNTDSDTWDSIRQNENYVWLDFSDSHIQNLKNAQSAWCEGYWYKYWTWENTELLEVDSASSRIKISVPEKGVIDTNRDFRIYNLLEELDSPGEWYIDNDAKKLYFYPPKSLSSDADIEVTYLNDALIYADNVHDVVFDSLMLKNSSGEAVKIDNSDRVDIAYCGIGNTGANGITVSKSNNIAIHDSEIFNTGAIGVMIDACGTIRNLTRCENEIKNCDIHDFGKVSRSYTPGVRIAASVGVNVLNNEIHEGTHSGMIYSGSEIKIEYNEIYNVLTMAADAGAIYSGRSYIDRGNEIKYNYLHDIYDNVNIKEPVVGIYLDDQLSGTEVESNILYKVDSGIFLSGGRDTVIRNNIIAEKTAADYNETDGRYAIMLRTSGLMPHRQSMVLDMLSMIDGLDLSSPGWQKYPYVNVYPKDNPGAPVRDVVENNVIWNHHNLKKYSDFENWSTVGENLVNSTDPGFVNAAEGNLNLKDDSGVFKKLSGFEKIPFDKIGRQ